MIDSYDPDTLASMAEFEKKYSIDQAASAAAAAPEINLPPCPFCGADNVVDIAAIPDFFFAACCECGGSTAGSPIAIRPVTTEPSPAFAKLLPAARPLFEACMKLVEAGDCDYVDEQDVLVDEATEMARAAVRLVLDR